MTATPITPAQTDALAKLAEIPPAGSEERDFWLEAAEQRGFYKRWPSTVYVAMPDDVLTLMSEARKQGQRDALAAASLSEGREDGGASFGPGCSASPSPTVSALTGEHPSRGPRHPWCQPGNDPIRRFVVRFEDEEKGSSVFDDELEARRYFERAMAGGWNCYLFAAMLRDPGLAAAALAGEAGTAETQSGSVHEHAADLSATPVQSPDPEASKLRDRVEALEAELSRRPPPYGRTFTCPKCGIERGWCPACMQDGCPVLGLEGEEVRNGR